MMKAKKIIEEVLLNRFRGEQVGFDNSQKIAREIYEALEENELKKSERTINKK